jgi:hypothetical protein
MANIAIVVVVNSIVYEGEIIYLSIIGQRCKRFSLTGKYRVSVFVRHFILSHIPFNIFLGLSTIVGFS